MKSAVTLVLLILALILSTAASTHNPAVVFFGVGFGVFLVPGLLKRGRASASFYFFFAFVFAAVFLALPLLGYAADPGGGSGSVPAGGVDLLSAIMGAVVSIVTVLGPYVLLFIRDRKTRAILETVFSIIEQLKTEKNQKTVADLLKRFEDLEPALPPAMVSAWKKTIDDAKKRLKK